MGANVGMGSGPSTLNSSIGGTPSQTNSSIGGPPAFKTVMPGLQGLMQQGLMQNAMQSQTPTGTVDPNALRAFQAAQRDVANVTPLPSSIQNLLAENARNQAKGTPGFGRPASLESLLREVGQVTPVQGALGLGQANPVQNAPGRFTSLGPLFRRGVRR